MRKTILFPLPDTDFDVTEVAVPWKLLTRAGHSVLFATEDGARATCDPLLLTGVIFGKLGAQPEPIAFYRELEKDPAFQRPLSWRRIEPDSMDALFLAGGHAPGMRQYLGSEELQRFVAHFATLDRPLAAICHGVLVLARSIDPTTGRSVLYKRRTTCLPKYMERSAYWLTAWKLGRYYRTYDAYVEEEVRGALRDPRQQFERGPRTLSARGSDADDRPAFTVRDGLYLSGRWPGDAYRISKQLLELFAEPDAAAPTV